MVDHFSHVPYKYYLKTPGDSGLTLPAFESDGWANVMNTNWDAIDTALKALDDKATANLAQAKLLQSGAERRNHLTNGNFGVWQQGSSVSVSTQRSDHSTYEDGVWWVDGWRVHRDNTSSQNCTINRTHATLGGLVVAQNGSNTYKVHLVQHVDRFKPMRGQTVTFSVGFQNLEVVSSATMGVAAEIYDGVARTTALTTIVPDSNSWRRFSVKRAIDSDATKVVVRIEVDMLAGTNTRMRVRRASLAYGDHSATGVDYITPPKNTVLRQARGYFYDANFGSGIDAASFSYRASGVGEESHHTISVPPFRANPTEGFLSTGCAVFSSTINSNHNAMTIECQPSGTSRTFLRQATLTNFNW